MQLPSELQAVVVAWLQPTSRRSPGRLLSRDLSMRLSNRAAQVRLPLPPAACDAAWQPHLHYALEQLTFDDKLVMLSAAAASGSETNLELAWGLLRPCLHPELLQRPHGHAVPAFYDFPYKFRGPDPGTAAVRAGHAGTVLPWLVRHGCPLAPENTLEAAAQHCDLAGLQAAWQLLGYSAWTPHNDATESVLYCTLARAAGLGGGDAAIPKLTWLRSVAPDALLRPRNLVQLLLWAAVGAAAAGALPVLTWLRGQGLDLRSARIEALVAVHTWKTSPMYSLSLQDAWAVVLGAALGGGHVAVADWLVDEARCLPAQPNWLAVLRVEGSAAAGGHVESLRWLQGRRRLQETGLIVQEAASAWHLDAVRFLLQECGTNMTVELFAKAAGSRSLATMRWLLQAGCPMDPEAYCRAASAGDVDMLVWLAREARCPWARDTVADVLREWPRTLAAARRGLQQAVRALEEAGCPPLGVGAGLGMRRRELAEIRYGAAVSGDLWLLRRLHEELGVGLGPCVMAEAAKAGCEVVLEWLVGVGCGPGEEGEFDPYARAGCNGDMGTLGCLVRLGVGFNLQVVRAAARSGAPLPVLRWLVVQGACGMRRRRRRWRRLPVQPRAMGRTVTVWRGLRCGWAGRCRGGLTVTAAAAAVEVPRRRRRAAAARMRAAVGAGVRVGVIMGAGRTVRLGVWMGLAMRGRGRRRAVWVMAARALKTGMVRAIDAEGGRRLHEYASPHSRPNRILNVFR